MIAIFCTPLRQQDLYRILKAYTIYRPDEGYCQAQAPVAAVLLMHMPAEVSICGPGWGGGEKILTYYGDGRAAYSLLLRPHPCLLVLALLSKPFGAWYRSATSTSQVTTVQGW